MCLKAFIATREVEIIVVTKAAPSEIDLHIFYVTKVVINSKVDVWRLEAVTANDLHGTAAVNLLCDISLATLEFARYYHYDENPPSDAITYTFYPEPVPVGPCDNGSNGVGTG